MAAHALTIANQILSVIERHRDGELTAQRAVNYAIGALNAPGMDAITYPGMGLTDDAYHYLYCRAKGLIDSKGNARLGMADEDTLSIEERIPLIEDSAHWIARECAKLKKYRTLESIPRPR